MNCKQKTTLKLSSNIISKAIGDKKLGVYIPVELKPKEYKDVRLRDSLSERQKRQLEKQLFWTDDVWENEERYPDRKENVEMCQDCQYKDICF
jgi:hypothetical protein